MKLSGRLLLTLIFCFLILPLIVKNSGLFGLQQLKENEEIYEKEIKKIATTKNDYTDKLLASIDRLSLRDAGLKQCVTNSLEKYFSVGDPSKHIQDAVELKSISCFRQNITSIVGIKSLKNLEILDLSYNKITDATPLSHLGKLKILNLVGNKDIDNIDALTNLYKLENVQFPDLNQSFCYQLSRSVENMESYNERAKHNAKIVRCRGKKTGAVTSALKKQDQGKDLTDKERQLISDYEDDQRWSN